MRARTHTLPLFLALLLIVQLACNFVSGGGTPDTVATLNGLYTASALTIEAQTGHTVTPGLPLPTVTGSPFPGYATNTPFSYTPAPVTRCDAASFVTDVSYPDGTVVSRNASFTKTWRLRNAGTCTWTSSYALVFYSGDRMGGSSPQSLSHSVSPGQTIDLSVALQAPDDDGKYRGYWKLRNASNSLFGLGALADTAFWVDIKVSGPSFAAYDFAAKYCQADWSNNKTGLPCPGAEGDDAGYVIQLPHPKLENGASQDDLGLLTVPRDSSNGLIRGQYPAFTVKSGDRFRARVYCRYNADHCDVTFRLDYLNNGQIKTLGSWHEVNEGQFYSIDLNLSSLAGETLKFILVVTANGSANDDEAIWLYPHILRQGSPPPAPTNTPTPTPTATFTATPTPTPTTGP